jgi:hypothetical protein
MVFVLVGLLTLKMLNLLKCLTYLGFIVKALC